MTWIYKEVRVSTYSYASVKEQYMYIIMYICRTRGIDYTEKKEIEVIHDNSRGTWIPSSVQSFDDSLKQVRKWSF